ncbi:MAG: MmcQ/YjbR family DNA-binding protein [Eubacteriales bacterium]|nr:MmcQ/YjbR family DNA-binding protein [Eubacteriales bacterium]
MTRTELECYITETYGAERELPWKTSPLNAVFRRNDTRKWFALVMNVPKRKLGLSDDGAVDILNVKCDPVIIGSLRLEQGFFPAYHMNKDSWISAALDGSAGEEQIKFLLERSYELTAPKRRKSPADPGISEKTANKTE